MDNKEQSAQSSTPLSQLLEEEIKRIEVKKQIRRSVWEILRVLIVVAAISVLISVMWIPVFQVLGSSMEPTLHDSEVVVAVKTSKFEQGDIIAFYYNNKVLLKRLIATGGDTVDILEDGTVYVNDVELEESYISRKSLGDCEIEFPYVVPSDRMFVLGDHRETSVDSRSVSVGAISMDQTIGKVKLRVWPLSKIGLL